MTAESGTGGDIGASQSSSNYRGAEARETPARSLAIAASARGVTTRTNANHASIATGFSMAPVSGHA